MRGIDIPYGELPGTGGGFGLPPLMSLNGGCFFSFGFLIK
jgi:hypothetical protein